jgi:hypothetical protein
MNLRSLFPSVRSLLAVISLAVGLLGLTLPAQASRSQESIFQDDRLLLNSSAAVQTQALDDLHAAGVKTIHAVINWKTLAPSPTKASVPRGFTGTDPASYSASRWVSIDNLVRGARARGLKLLLTPAGPAPEWALKCTSFEKRKYGQEKGTCKPNPKLYGAFVTALAKRYDGTYADASGATLPKVVRWSIWNEPNLNSWISPQIIKIRGVKVSIGAVTYRNLVYAATKALRGHGHRRDQILLGETAPIGLGTKRTAPATFYQTVFCVNASGRKLRGSAAKNAGCRGAKRLDVNGVAHHPYTKAASQPLLAKQRPNDITMASLGVLSRVLKQGVRAHMLKSSATGIYITEFGVSSRPPARRGAGVKLSSQAEYVNEFEYLAFKNPRVKGVSQFQLEDDANLTNKAFQTGLRFQSGKNKPAYAAYRVPLYVQRKGSRLTIWGGVRGKSGSVQIFNGKKKVKTVRLRRGYFLTSMSSRSGNWQLQYKDPASGKTLKSRVAAARTLPRGF